MKLFSSIEYNCCVQNKMVYCFANKLFSFITGKNTQSGQYSWEFLGWKVFLYMFQRDVIKSNILAGFLEANGS